MSGGLTIAVDGPAASGKSTLARRLAAHYGLAFLDTGLLYRAVGRRLLDNDVDPGDEEAAVEAARLLETNDVDPALLTAEDVGRAASQVAAYGRVREALLPFQQAFARQAPGAVLAGRDVGTIVCPSAEVKLFVVASLKERARRRFDELRRRGEEPIYARVLDELGERDRRDAQRSVAPLRAADDAWVLDTTELDAHAAFKEACRHIDSRLKAGDRRGGAS